MCSPFDNVDTYRVRYWHEDINTLRLSYAQHVSQLEEELAKYKHAAFLQRHAPGELRLLYHAQLDKHAANEKEISRLNSLIDLKDSRHRTDVRKFGKERTAKEEEIKDLEWRLMFAEAELDEERKNVKRARDEAKHDEEEIGRLKRHLSELQWLEAEFAKTGLSPLTRQRLGM